MLALRSRTLQTSRRAFSATATKLSTVELACDSYSPSGSPRTDVGPLVLLHGLYGSKQNWRSLARGLAQRTEREVHALDLRNHGTSPSAADASYTALAGDVAAFLESRGLNKVALMGHSMGGKVAMALALRPHEAIERLIVVDMAPGIGKISPEFRQYLDAMQAIDDAQVKSRKEADEMLQETEKDLGVRAFLLTNLERSADSPYYKFRLPLQHLSNAIEQIGDFPYSAEEAGASRTFDGPTLVFKGAKSKYINRHNIPLLEKFFPHMQLKTLDAGHWVHAERPKEFVEEMVAFCK